MLKRERKVLVYLTYDHEEKMMMAMRNDVNTEERQTKALHCVAVLKH